MRTKMKRIDREFYNSDPGPSKKKGRRSASEENKEEKIKKKRVRSLVEQRVPDESCREEKRRREESDKGQAATVRPPPAQPSRPDPLRVSSYSFFSMLGDGAFGKVMLAKLKTREPYVAIKYIEKTKKTNYNLLVSEAQVLRISRECQFLCQGYAAFQTQVQHEFNIAIECHICRDLIGLSE
ncbi:protein kinase C epsilon type-like [Xenopus laevis]|uniref:Protein kinase C epsilon type-like n=1 Tax=Xenopus laevis TaxID=8355 RepID=A0A8J1L8R8_XENLA|nr:protein kinase C epsilon type-like [Xenopus laevis]